MKGNFTQSKTNKWNYLQEIAKPYALDILEELSKGNRRFSELKHLCKSQKTLTIRLYELIELGVIETQIEKPKKKRMIVFYKITEKGKRSLEIASEFMKI
jgi:DNA-binding HxlR family transcriptional regulator